MNKKTIFLLLIIGIFFLTSADLVNACSCVPPAPPLESLEQATAVFSGEVTDIKVLSRFSIESLTSEKVTSNEVTFKVFEVWKGPSYKTLALTTARVTASCGYLFKKGEEYLVYAFGEENDLRTSTCSRTKLLSDAQEDLAELNKGAMPAGEEPDLAKSKLIQNFLLPVGIILVLAIPILLLKKFKR